MPQSPLAIHLEKAQENELKSIDLSIRFGEFISLCGVSGSGKSTIVQECLMPIAKHNHNILSKSTKFIHAMYKPNVQSATVPFIIDVKQGRISTSNRSIVGSALGIIPKAKPLLLSNGGRHG